MINDLVNYFSSRATAGEGFVTFRLTSSISISMRRFATSIITNSPFFNQGCIADLEDKIK